MLARVGTMRARARFYVAAALTTAINAVQILDGRATAKAIRAELGAEVASIQKTHGVTPGLGVLLVGDRRDSLTYVRMKRKAADEVGIFSSDVTLPSSASEDDVLEAVSNLNADPQIHGILVQLPMPDHIDEERVLGAIDYEKDVDGFHPLNTGRLAQRGREPLFVPCTPRGCIELLERSGIEIAGKEAVVVGRSNVVGIPAAMLLQRRDATVTIVHSKTPNSEEIVRRADIVIAACGRMEMVKGSWLKPGAAVIDVGINAKDDASKKLGYRLVGDADFESCKEVAGAITPVPGGVGPMTIAILLKNTMEGAMRANGLM